MNRTTLPGAIAMVVAGFATTWLWQHREREPVAPLQEPSVTLSPPRTASAVSLVDMAAPVKAASGAPPPLPTDAVARDIEMRKRNPNYIGEVKGKSGAMQLTYPDLARELNLTPEQAEALYDLLTRHQAELSALSRNAGYDLAAKQDLERARAELQARQSGEFDAAIGGHEREWQQYQPTLEARRRVSELTNMVATTSPLNEEQTRVLVATVVREHRMRADEQASRGTPANNPLAQLEFAEQNQTSREQSNHRTVEAMRSYLTAQQLTIMENAMAGLNRQIRANLQAQRAQLEGSNAP